MKTNLEKEKDYLAKSIDEIRQTIKLEIPEPKKIYTLEDDQEMHFLLDDVVKQYEETTCGFNRCCLPSVADAHRKAYYSREKLTLAERWYLMWSDECYPLKHI